MGQFDIRIIIKQTLSFYYLRALWDFLSSISYQYGTFSAPDLSYILNIR